MTKDLPSSYEVVIMEDNRCMLMDTRLRSMCGPGDAIHVVSCRTDFRTGTLPPSWSSRSERKRSDAGCSDLGPWKRRMQMWDGISIGPSLGFADPVSNFLLGVCAPVPSPTSARRNPACCHQKKWVRSMKEQHHFPSSPYELARFVRLVACAGRPGDQHP